jgi:hypothetical protein
MDYLQPILHVAQAGLSGYSLYHAYIAIINLRQYEEKSEKAAEWSATAEHELHKTRTTQTSSALSVYNNGLVVTPRIEYTNNIIQLLSSFVTSVGLVFSSTPTIVELLLNAGNIAVCVMARTHISNFWANKSKVPFVKGFNAAMTSTNIIEDHLGILAISWIATSVVEAWRLGSS